MWQTQTSAARMIVRSAGIYHHHARQDPLPRELYNVPLQSLADAIIREKVSSLLLDRLRVDSTDLVDSLNRLPAFAEVRSRISTLVRHKANVLGVLDREAKAIGIEVSAVKGLAAQLAYPDPSVRDLGDLDLMVADADTAIRLTHRLLDYGYDFHSMEWPWIKRSVDSGVIYGQFSLKHGDVTQNPAIDLHFGGYSIRHCGLHALDVREPAPGLSYYSMQQNLPLIIGNSAGDHEITTKDLNDLALAMTDPAIDWALLLTELRAVNLLGFFKRMVDALEATSLQGIYQDSPLPALLKGVRREIPGPKLSWARQRRWAVTVLHAYDTGARHSRIHAGKTSLTALRYYWGDRTVKVRPRPNQSAPRLPALNNWTCVRLIPMAMLDGSRRNGDDSASRSRPLSLDGPLERLSAELNIVHSPNGDIVRTVLGDFVPVVYTLDFPLTGYAE